MDINSEPVYYASVFVVGAVAGMSRAWHNGDFRSGTHLASIALFSGLLGFALVAILYGFEYVSQASPRVLCLGIAAFIGLSGKEQINYIGAINRTIKSKFGITESNKPNGPNDP